MVRLYQKKKFVLKACHSNIRKESIRNCKDFEEVTLFVINGDHLEDGQALYKKLQEDCPSAYQVAYSEFGPVVSAHLGSGGLGLAMLAKNKINIIIKF